MQTSLELSQMRPRSIAEIAEMVKQAEGRPKLVGVTSFHTKRAILDMHVFDDGSFFIDQIDLFPQHQISPEYSSKLQTLLDSWRKKLKDSNTTFILCQSPK